jgi:hypothetical protein
VRQAPKAISGADTGPQSSRRCRTCTDIRIRAEHASDKVVRLGITLKTDWSASTAISVVFKHLPNSWVQVFKPPVRTVDAHAVVVPNADLNGTIEI